MRSWGLKRELGDNISNVFYQGRGCVNEDLVD